MPRVSIVMPCFNSEKYLEKAVDSIVVQSFTAWELIIVDDGSTDTTLKIAKEIEQTHNRIQVVTKENGGYVSARLHGLKYVSLHSEYFLFFDSDDILQPSMLSKLVEQLESKPAAGAVFCNHLLIDENDKDLGLPTYGIRTVPTALWMKPIKEDVMLTPFISIFCWASRMIEPMTLIRKKAYLNSSGWDISFGKGVGNIGDGVLLFSEIALAWDVLYIETPLYLYRKHSGQSTATTSLNTHAGEKVINIWSDYIKEDPTYTRDIKGAIICYRHRVYAYAKSGSLKHTLRYRPSKFISLLFSISWHWLLSLQLFFFRDTRVFQHR